MAIYEPYMYVCTYMNQEYPFFCRLIGNWIEYILLEDSTTLHTQTYTWDIIIIILLSQKEFYPINQFSFNLLILEFSYSFTSMSTDLYEKAM